MQLVGQCHAACTQLRAHVGILGIFNQAVAAGGNGVVPPEDMFWGDRYGQLKDPFGVTWAMSQTKS